MSKRPPRVGRREGRRGPRTLVRGESEFEEVGSLDEGLELICAELLGPMRELATSSSVAILLPADPHDDGSDAARDFPNTPPAFLRTVSAAGLGFVFDREGTAPILVLDMGEAIAAFVVSPEVLDAYGRAQHESDFDTRSKTPHPLMRWVVAINYAGAVFRTAIGGTSSPAGAA